MRLDGTLESMWIVSACHVLGETGNNTRTNRYAQVHKNAQQLRRDTASRQAQQTLWISRPDSHKLKPESRFSQVKVPNTVAHNEAEDIFFGEMSRVIQMLTRSELCGHRNAPLNSRIPCLAPDVIEQLDSSCPLDV